MIHIRFEVDPPPPQPQLGQVKNTVKVNQRPKPKQGRAHKLIIFFCVFTRFEGFCMEWKQK